MARLTKFDLPPFVQVPDSMVFFVNVDGEYSQTRRRIALEAVWRIVQSFVLGFLEEECGLKRSGPNLEGFEKVPVKD